MRPLDLRIGRLNALVPARRASGQAQRAVRGACQRGAVRVGSAGPLLRRVFLTLELCKVERRGSEKWSRVVQKVSKAIREDRRCLLSGALRLLRQLSASVSPVEALLAYGTAGMSSLPSIQGIDLRTSPPPLPDRVARRENLVATLSQQTKIHGLLVLKGPTGMGKSTLAALIAHADTEEWTWLRMRGQEPDQIRELLYQAALIHPAQSSEVRVVLDDLNFGAHTAQYEDALTGLLYAISSRGGQVIMTTQGDIPSRVTARFPMAAVSSIEVPPLAVDEIKQMVLDHGCPSEDKQNIWTVLLWAKTRGHPQLVHATVRKLEATGWPIPGSSDGSEAEDIEAVRREASSALHGQLPSEEAKSLQFLRDRPS